MAQALNEEQLQSQCFIWFWNTYPKHRGALFHVQQKAKNRIEGAKFKAMGVVQGISDMILILDGAVLFIEMKFGNNTQSKEQKDFEKLVTERGHFYGVIRDLETFKSLIYATVGTPTH